MTESQAFLQKDIREWASRGKGGVVRGRGGVGGWSTSILCFPTHCSDVGAVTSIDTQNSLQRRNSFRPEPGQISLNPPKMIILISATLALQNSWRSWLAGKWSVHGFVPLIRLGYVYLYVYLLLFRARAVDRECWTLHPGVALPDCVYRCTVIVILSLGDDCETETSFRSFSWTCHGTVFLFLFLF